MRVVDSLRDSRFESRRTFSKLIQVIVAIRKDYKKAAKGSSKISKCLT